MVTLMKKSEITDWKPQFAFRFIVMIKYTMIITALEVQVRIFEIIQYLRI